MSYICRNCGFRTEHSKGKTCPYCDRNSLELEKSAEELVSEVKIE